MFDQVEKTKIRKKREKTKIRSDSLEIEAVKKNENRDWEPSIQLRPSSRRRNRYVVIGM